MLNGVTVVGRINYIYIEDNILEIKCIKQLYKNDVKSGEEEVYIPVMLSDSIMNKTKQYCDINDIVGVKGWLRNRDEKLIVMADKLTFLASTKDTDEKGGETDDSE